MLGPILIITGIYWMWVAWHGKAGPMWNAITGDSGFDSTLNNLGISFSPQSKGSSQGSSKSSPVSGNTPDSGTHMGIDSSGNIITINNSYANMTAAEKDAANAYAHQIGNVNA